MSYRFYEVEIVEMQSENNPYGDPDDGCPQEALNDFLNLKPRLSEECITKGEHMFIIWEGEDMGTYFANAWSLPNDGEESEFTTYYEFKTDEVTV